MTQLLTWSAGVRIRSKMPHTITFPVWNEIKLINHMQQQQQQHATISFNWHSMQMVLKTSRNTFVTISDNLSRTHVCIPSFVFFFVVLDKKEKYNFSSSSFLHLRYSESLLLFVCVHLLVALCVGLCFALTPRAHRTASLHLLLLTQTGVFILSWLYIPLSLSLYLSFSSPLQNDTIWRKNKTV